MRLSTQYNIVFRVYLSEKFQMRLFEYKTESQDSERNPFDQLFSTCNRYLLSNCPYTTESNTHTHNTKTGGPSIIFERYMIARRNHHDLIFKRIFQIEAWKERGKVTIKKPSLQKSNLEEEKKTHTHKQPSQKLKQKTLFLIQKQNEDHQWRNF